MSIFNYQDLEALNEKYDAILDENEELRKENASLRIQLKEAQTDAEIYKDKFEQAERVLDSLRPEVIA